MPLTTDNPGAPFDPNATVNLPGCFLPNFRTVAARAKGVEKNILITVHGGMGDAICAEPSIRYACKTFKDSQISVQTHWPELVRHLPLKEIFDRKKVEAPLEEYFVFQTLYEDDFSWQFHVHFFTHIIDHHSLVMFRVQLTPQGKQIRLVPTEEECKVSFQFINPEKDILIHAGRTWPSRTFPPKWWDAVLMRIRKKGKRPVLIGGDSKGDRGTVAVNPRGCLDLRGKLSIMETVAVTQRGRVLLTNDSSPIHMAASGNAWIGFVATAKRPDLIMHTRHEVLGWRMQNHSLGGRWQQLDMNPAHGEPLRFDLVDPKDLESWLPDAEDFADWGLDRLEAP
jgi:ADP-heptose:LPS heptosyltransferase